MLTVVEHKVIDSLDARGGKVNAMTPGENMHRYVTRTRSGGREHSHTPSDISYALHNVLARDLLEK